MAVADATDVRVREVTQVPKCRARAAPLATTRPSGRPRSPDSSSRRWTATPGESATVAKAFRQKAIASGGTTIAAINGPESDTATTPTASRRRVRTAPIVRVGLLAGSAV